MSSRALHLCMLALLGVAADVLTLDGGNFTVALRANPRLLLLFYAPWCVHSRSRPFEATGKLHRVTEVPQRRLGSSLPVNCCACKQHSEDASMEVEVAEEFGIGAYPGVFLVQKHKYEEFSGRRTAVAIAEWTRGKVGPALEVVSSVDKLQAALVKRGVLSAVVASGSDTLQKAIGRVAERHRALGIFLFMPDGTDSVKLYRGLNEVLTFEVQAQNPEDLDAELLGFVQRERLPLFGEISEENFYHYETSGLNGLLWVLFANSTGQPCLAGQCSTQAAHHSASLREVAESFGTKVVYTDAATHKEFLAEELGVRQFPALVVQKGPLGPARELEKYVLQLDNANVNADTITAWLEKVLPRPASPEREGL
ncbi:unnamed protein product [Effrenium voratum]|nr:unnamed protein product [Effrenium voratum]